MPVVWRATVSYAAERSKPTEEADLPESVSLLYFKDFKKQCVSALNGLKPHIMEPLKVNNIKNKILNLFSHIL